MFTPLLPTEPKPDTSIDHEHRPTVELVQFGDGYVGRYVNGINAELNTFTLRYTNLFQTERNIIYNFIKSMQGAKAFLYQFLEDPAPRKFIAPDGIREVKKNGGFYDLEFTMQEVFDADPGLEALFLYGAVGAWYDPSDLNTLFQERTGASASTPAVVDGPVGTMLDKSGNGFHLKTTADGYRPILRQSGGLYYLETDAVDDFMASDAVYNFSFPHYVAATMRRSVMGTQSLFGFRSGGVNAAHGVIDSSSNSRAASLLREDGGTSYTVISADNSFPVDTVKFLDTYVDEGHQDVGVNSSVVEEDTHPLTNGDSFGIGSIVITGTGPTTSAIKASRFYGGIIYKGDLLPEIRTSIRSALGAKGGLTI